MKNLRSLLKRAEIDENEFVEKANEILMKDYKEIDKKIKSLLAEMSDEKKSVEVGWLFDRIELEDYEKYLKILH